MAITPTTGSAANSASAASLALPAFNLTAGQDVAVVVVLGSNASAVTSITDTKGNTYVFKKAQDGATIRIEFWESHSVGAQTSNIITINVSPNTDIAGAAEEYASVASYGNTGGATETSVNPRQLITTQEGSNWPVVGVGFAAQSGDTLATQNGTLRQSSIPAATRVGVALYDSTMVVDGQVFIMSRISNSREWVTAGVELRVVGGVAVPAVDYAATVAAELQQDKDMRYLRVKMPPGGGELSGGGGAWPFVG